MVPKWMGNKFVFLSLPPVTFYKSVKLKMSFLFWDIFLKNLHAYIHVCVCVYVFSYYAYMYSNGHLGCIQLCAPINNLTMNTALYISLWASPDYGQGNRSWDISLPGFTKFRQFPLKNCCISTSRTWRFLFIYYLGEDKTRCFSSSTHTNTSTLYFWSQFSSILTLMGVSTEATG